MALMPLDPWDAERWMREALTEARAAGSLGEVPIGALVLGPDHQILGRGGNRVELFRDASAHAEMIALRQAQQALSNWRLEDCTLVVTLEPCPMCAGHVLWSRVGRLIYGASDPRLGACGSKLQILEPNPLLRPLEIHRGILEDECSAVIRQFFQKRRAENKAQKKQVLDVSEPNTHSSL